MPDPPSPPPPPPPLPNDGVAITAAAAPVTTADDPADLPADLPAELAADLAWAEGPDHTRCPRCDHELWPVLAVGRRRCSECGEPFRLQAEPRDRMAVRAVGWGRRCMVLAGILALGDAVREIIYIAVNMVFFDYFLADISWSVFGTVPMGGAVVIAALIPVCARWLDGPGRFVAWAIALGTAGIMFAYWIWYAYQY